MPNFTIGGIDVEAEPTFKGFHSKAKEGLAAEEARLSFEVEARPVLMTGFQRDLRERIAKATESVKFEVEANPALAKGFQSRLRELVDKSSGGVSVDIEARPTLAKGFKTDLRAMVDRGAAGIHMDVEARPTLMKGFRKELSAQVDAAAAGGAGKITVSAELAKDFRAKLEAKLKVEAKAISIEIPVSPKFDGAEFRNKLFTYLDVITGGVKIEIPVVPKIDDLPAFKARLKTLIDLAGSGLTIDVQIRPVLGPGFAAQAAGAVKAAESANRLTFRVNADSKGLGQSIKNELGSVATFAKQGVGATLSVLEGSLSRVIGLAKVATVGVGLLAVGILAVGASGVKSAADLELQERSLQILLQSQEKGTKLFKGIQQVAVTTPFEVPDLTPIARQLLVIRTTLGDKNFGLDRILPSVKTITDLGAALGATGPQLGRVGQALSKVAGRGKITAEELRSLSKNLPGFSAIQAIADKLGVSVPEAFKKVSAGAVDSKTAIDGILEGMARFPGAAGAAAKQAQTTFKGALSNFPDIARNTFYDAFRSELPQLTKVIGPNGDLVKTMEAALPAIARAFTPIATAVLQLIQGLVPALQATITAALPIILAVAKALGSLAPVFTALGNALGVVLAPIAKDIGFAAIQINSVLVPAINAARPAFKILGDGFTRLIVGLSEGLQAFAPAISVIATFAGKLLDTIAPIIPIVVNALVPAIALIAPVATDLFKVVGAVVAKLSPLIPIVAELAAVIGKALIDALHQVDFKSIISGAGSVADAIGKLFIALSPLIPAFVTIATTIVTSLVPVVLALTPLIAGLLTVLIPVLEALANLAPLVALIFVLGKVVAAVKLIGVAFGDVVKGFELLRTGTFNSLNNLSPNLGDKVFSGLVTAAAVAGSAVAGYMAGMAKDAIGSLTSIASAGVGVFVAFKQGGPIAAALAGLAAVVGYFFGVAKKKSEDAKAANAAYNDSVKEISKSFDASGIDKFSSAQAKAAAISELLVKDLKGSGAASDNANGAFKNLGISFSTVVDALSRGRGGIHDLNAEVERATGYLSKNIAEKSAKGIETFGRNSDIAKSSLSQLTDQLGRAALGGNDQSGLFAGVKNVKDLTQKLHEAGDGTATLANVTERYQALLQRNMLASPAAQYILTLGPKTREAINMQTELGRVQKLAADEQDRQSGAGTRFSSAYEKVAGSLDKSTSAYRNWLAVQRGATVDLAAVKLGVIDYAKQLRDLNNDPELSPFEKQNKALVLLSGAQDAASGSISRFVSESGGNYAAFTMKVVDLKNQIAEGLVSSLGISRQKAQELVDTVIQLPTEPEFKLLADTSQAVAGLSDVQQRIQDYILSKPENKMFLDALDPADKLKFIGVLVDQYKNSDPKTAAFLEAQDPITKAKLLKDLLNNLDGTVASAQVDLKVNVLQEMAKGSVGAGVVGEIAGQKAIDELRRRGVPGYAIGGIIKKAQYALIGESGPEVVLPLGDAARMGELLQQLGVDATAAAAIAATLSGAPSPAAGPVAPSLGPSLAPSAAGPGPGPDAANRAAGLVTAATDSLAPLGAKLEKATTPGLATWVASVNLQATQIGTNFTAMADTSTATAAALPFRLVNALVPGVASTANQVGFQANRVTTAFIDMGNGSTAAVAIAGQNINASLVASGQQLAANAAAAGANAVEAMNRELQAGTGKVGATVAKYGSTLAGGLNPVLAAVGAQQIPVTKLARGGDVHGPNVRADIVPALLMPGEFVVKRDSVEKFGSAALHALNRGQVPTGWNVPRFAGGGQVTGDVVGLNPAFKSRLGLWSAAVGETYNVGSGYRSIAEQVRLYQRYLAGVPGQAPAAPPGRSMHNFGLASDGNRWRDRNPGAFGLRFPMSYEAWHVEPVEAREWAKGGVQPDGAAGGAGFTGITPLPKPPAVGLAGSIGGAGTAAMEYAYQKSLGWAGKQAMAAPAGSSSIPGVAGVSSPAEAVQWIMAAIAATGVPNSWLNGLLTIAKRESNFNPLSVNLWDSNARKGTPSKGLMQTIDPTFRAYALPGHGNIYNPVDNAIAAIRYILATYGDISKVQQANPNAKPKGYADGGVVSREDVVRVAEKNKPEAIIPLTNPARARQVANESGLTAMLRDQIASSGPMFAAGAVQVTVAAPDAASPEAYGASVGNRLAPALADAVTQALGA